MKIRQGFVSNSSSASFVVALSVLTEKDIRKIMSYNNHIKTKRGWCDFWDIKVDDKKEIIVGSTFMNNGDLDEYLGKKLARKLTYHEN